MNRRNTPRISFIGFGEAGQAIASGLRDVGIEPGLALGHSLVPLGRVDYAARALGVVLRQFI